MGPWARWLWAAAVRALWSPLRRPLRRLHPTAVPRATGAKWWRPLWRLQRWLWQRLPLLLLLLPVWLWRLLLLPPLLLQVRWWRWRWLQEAAPLPQEASPA